MEENRKRHAPAALIMRKRNHGAEWIRGWLVPTADLNDMKKRKISLLLPRIEPQFPHRPTHSFVVTFTKLYQLIISARL
jgi:hypothetical protein